MIHWTEKHVNAFFFIFYIYRLLANALWAVYICQLLEIANSLEEYRTFFPPLIGYFISILNLFRYAHQHLVQNFVRQVYVFK